MRSRIVAGPLVAAAMLALLAFSPARQQQRDLPHLRPWRPTVAQRFAAAMQASQHDLSSVTYRDGQITAIVRIGATDQLPRLRVDAAIAASRVRHTCACVLSGYRVMTDRFGPDPILVAAGRALPVAPGGPDSDIIVHMDGAGNRAIATRARRLVADAPEFASRVTITIVRDGRVALSAAWRPATGEGWTWAQTGIRAPRLPQPDGPPPPITPFASTV
jgi:hypothetical protein